MELTVDLNTWVNLFAIAGGVVVLAGVTLLSHRLLAVRLDRLEGRIDRLEGRVDAIMLFLASPSSDTRKLLLPTGVRAPDERVR